MSSLFALVRPALQAGAASFRWVASRLGIRRTLESGRTPRSQIALDSDELVRHLGVTIPGDGWIAQSRASFQRLLTLPEHVRRETLQRVFDRADNRLHLLRLVQSRLDLDDHLVKDEVLILVSALEEAGVDGNGQARASLDQLVLSLRQFELENSRDPDLARTVVSVEENVRAAINGQSGRLADGAVSSASHLDRAIRLSRLAADDADRVETQSVVGPATHGRSVALHTVYVPRSIESEVDKWLNRDRETAAALVVVIGQAGHGKTSLLWNVYRRYSEQSNWRPILAKASWLIAGEDGDVLGTDVLIGAARELTKLGSRPLLLIDTADLLLHNEVSRAKLLAFLGQVTSEGSQVVMATRPEEATLIAWDGADGRRVDLFLRQYDELVEFPVAVTKYAEAYYAASASLDAAQEGDRIRTAVANGKPLREVCLNPLSLRMLFSLYAPHEVSQEVNVFSLYCDYWLQRVTRDQRGGQPVNAGSNLDLSVDACRIALEMLAIGVPVLSANQLRSLVVSGEVTSSAVAALRSRAVLASTENGTVEFFHQSFFEHAAARALLFAGAREGIELLSRRVDEHPMDLFILPVLEQTLLLGLRRSDSVHQVAIALLSKRLNATDPTQWDSALAVYVMADKVSSNVVARVKELVEQGHDIVIRRAIDLLPNMAAHRADEAFLLLELIWKNPGWRVRQHALRLIIWLAGVDWARTEAFVDANDVLATYQRESPIGFARDRELLHLIKVGLHRDTAWARTRLIFLLKSKALNLDSAVQFIERNAALFDHNSLVEEVSAAVGSSGGGTGLAVNLGRLLTLRWRQHDSKPISILADLRRVEDVDLKARLNALSRVLCEDRSSDWDVVLDFMSSEQLPNRRWAWISAFVMPTLRHSDGAATITSYCVGRKAVVGWLSQQLRLADFGGDRLDDHGYPMRMLARVVRERTLTDDEFLDLLQSASPAAWKSADRLGACLVDALRLCIPAALQAFDEICSEEDVPAEIHRVIDSSLLDKVLHPALVEVHLKWAATMGNVDALSRVVEGCGTAENVRVLLPVADRLLALCGLAIESRSATSRWRAADLLVRLIDYELIEPIDSQIVDGWYEQEREQGNRANLLRLFGCARFQEESALEVALDKVFSFGSNGSTNQRRLALASYVLMRPQVAADEVLWASRGMQLATVPGADEWHLRHVGLFVDFLIDRSHVDAAQTLVLRFLKCEALKELGAAGKRQLAHHVAKPLDRLFRLLSREERRRYLEFAKSSDRLVARVIIEVMCRTSLKDMADLLDALISDSTVPEESKLLIYTYRRHVDASWRGTAWPEVIDFWGSSALAAQR